MFIKIHLIMQVWICITENAIQPFWYSVISVGNDYVPLCLMYPQLHMQITCRYTRNEVFAKAYKSRHRIVAVESDLAVQETSP